MIKGGKLADQLTQSEINKDKTEVSWLDLTEKKTVPKKTEPVLSSNNFQDTKPKAEVQVKIAQKTPLPKTTPDVSHTDQIPPETHMQEINKTNKIIPVFKTIGIITGVFVFIYLFMTLPAILAKFSYWWKENVTHEKPQVQTIIPETVNTDMLFLSTVTHYSPPEKSEEQSPEQTTKTLNKESLGVTELSNNQLWIAKLDKRVPIVWDSPVDEDTMQQNLKYGVVHYLGTTKPGERAENGEGNIFISGHSSYYWWDDGKYKTTFANLDQMEIGDEIAIGYDNKAYIYRVFETLVVQPEDTWVVAQDTDKPILSLMTCVPVGTNLRRLVVRSELIAVGTDQKPEEKNEPAPEEKPIEKVEETPIIKSQPLPSILPNLDAINLLPWRW